MSEYADLVARSIVRAVAEPVGGEWQFASEMRHHQRVATEFALQQGRSASFLDTGLGKSLCEFVWGENVARATDKPVLIFAPLGVVGQHVAEAKKFGIDINPCKSQSDVKRGVNVTNYDRIQLFDPGAFAGNVLDESGIIKNFSGVMSRQIMQFGSVAPYRLAASATPAPNDHMELGQHCQYLGVMSSSNMLSRWFLADQSEMGRYRLKRHGVQSFWAWVSSWARCAELPSDLGGDDTGYVLPELVMQRHIVRTDMTVDAICRKSGERMLFRIPESSATSIHKEKRLTANDRARTIAELVSSEPTECWLVWCETDYDVRAFMELVPEAVEVHGRMLPDEKTERLKAFGDGTIRVLVTKPSIAGWGLNWQHCARMAFVGLSFSYEGFYQAIRRCWRYGQTRPVHVHVACAESEETIWATVNRKRDDHSAMKVAMRRAMALVSETRQVQQDYKPKTETKLPTWLKG